MNFCFILNYPTAALDSSLASILSLVHHLSHFESLLSLLNGLQALWNNIEEKEKAKFLLELAKFLATFGGAAAVLWNIKLSQDNRNLVEEKIDAETFAKGIDQLNKNEATTTRLGGVFTLEQVAINSKRYYPIVISVLTSLLKEINQDDARFYSKRLIEVDLLHSRKKYKEVSHEFLTVLETLKQLERTKKRDSLRVNSVLEALNRLHKKVKRTKERDVSKSNRSRDKHSRNVSSLLALCNLSMKEAFLECIDLSGFDLSGSDFSGSLLMSAKFINSRLEGVNFTGSSLGTADFEGANLEEADFSNADLSRANLKYANLAYSILVNSNLSDAVIDDSTRFDDADVSGATLSGCKLSPDQEEQFTNLESALRQLEL